MLGLGILLGGFGGICADSQPIDEYKAKALFLYNFAKFVEWPPEAFQSSTEAVSVCVLGTDPFGTALEDTLLGKTIGDRPLTVHRITDARRSGACRILFVSSSERRNVVRILEVVNAEGARMKSCGILTVGETDRFTSDGGIIRFLLESGKIRFEINTDAAAQHRLRISSKLLTLAKIVKK